MEEKNQPTRMRRWRARSEMLPADELMRSRWADREMWWVDCRQVCGMSGAGSREGEGGRHTQTQTESDGPCPHTPEYFIKQRFLPFGLLHTHKLGLIYRKSDADSQAHFLTGSLWAHIASLVSVNWWCYVMILWRVWVWTLTEWMTYCLYLERHNTGMAGWNREMNMAADNALLKTALS